MFPAVAPATRPRPLLEVHGFMALWVVPHADAQAPAAMTDTFRLRWAVLRVDAHPMPYVHILTRVGFMVDPPLLDLSVSWTRIPALNVTIGQFRQPFGAAATTLAPNLVMLDRPSYVYAMTKATFRDVGVMLGTGDAGLFGGVLHYRLSATAGTGRLGVAAPSLADDVRAPLYTARLIADFGRLWLGPRDRLALGATVAYTRDPAIDTADPAAARRVAASALGRTWTPIGVARDTLLAGADLTFSAVGLWAQAEWMFLASRGVDDRSVRRRAMGGSLEVAYTLPVALDDARVQVAARGELVDPDLDADGDGYAVVQGLVSLLPEPFVRLSLAAQATAYERPGATSADPREARVGSEITLRAAVTY
jgi:hypothetical protein